jgi:Ni,Fe-hydrogenase III small subunit/NAD-dependent dihydropyrimidine dehydrogenase PreA subunit
MIFEVPKRSLFSPRVVIPIEDLLGNSQGSRMPGVDPLRLTAAVAQTAVDACPTQALAIEPRGQHQLLRMDYAECIGCGRCVEAGGGAFFQADQLACCGAGRRTLIRYWDFHASTPKPGLTETSDGHATEWVEEETQVNRISQEIMTHLGRALNVRELDAGSCNGCEGEIVALTNPYYDLERFGIHFVASPKHADMLLVTGPVTRNMAEAVKRTYEAVPSPKLVVAVGACGCSGGIFTASHAVVGPVDAVIPVDGYIPGCPPTPAMLLTGILQALRRR